MPLTTVPPPRISHLLIHDWGLLPPETALCREALLLRRPSPNTLAVAFWQPSRPAVVLGKGLEPSKEVFLQAAEARGLRLLTRFSGGGAVYLPGSREEAVVLCAALILPVPGSNFADFPISKVHELGGNVLSGALVTLGVEASLRGTGDVAVGNRKIAGSAQCRRKNAILYHASILIEAPLRGMERYLRMPSKAPDYRAGRSHRDFVTDLVSLTGEDPAELRRILPALIGQSARRVLGL